MPNLYDISKLLKEHRLLIKKHADAPYICRCKPENLEPCEACDLNRMFNDLSFIIDELPR